MLLMRVSYLHIQRQMRVRMMITAAATEAPTATASTWRTGLGLGTSMANRRRGANHKESRMSVTGKRRLRRRWKTTQVGTSPSSWHWLP